jgi:hypothetical protein
VLNGDSSLRHRNIDSGFRIVHPNNAIMDRVATMRGISLLTPPKIKLPDCIIRATAESQG